MREFGFAKKHMRLWRVMFFVHAASALVGAVVFTHMVWTPTMLDGPASSPPSAVARVLHLGSVYYPVSVVFASGCLCLTLWLLRRVLKTVYLVDQTGITRVRPDNQARVDFSEVRAVRHKWFGIALQTPGSSMTVPAPLESYDELVRLLKEGLERAGGEFPEGLFTASVRGAARARWDLENIGKRVAVVMVAVAVMAGLGFEMGYFLEMGDDGNFLAAVLSALFFAGLSAALMQWLSSRRFRDADKPGWEAPGSAFAWKVLLLCAGMTIVLYIAVVTAVLCLFT